MLGAIIGDIVGSRWEFNRTNDYNFPLFSDKNGFTDDTICTPLLQEISQFLFVRLFVRSRIEECS